MRKMKKWNWYVFLLVIALCSGGVAHADWGQNAQFTPNGKTMLAHKILWRLPEGRELRRYETPFCTLSPDGRFVATSDGKVLESWDVATGKSERRVELQIGSLDLRAAAWPLCALVSGGREFMLAIADKYKITFYVFDTQNGKLLRNIPTSANTFSGGRIALDGKTFVLGGEENYKPFIGVWDVASGKLARRIDGDLSAGHDKAAALSPDGKLLALGTEDKSVRLIEISTGNIVGEIGDKDGAVKALAFSPDAHKLLIAIDDVIHTEGELWNISDGKQLCNFEIKPMMFPNSAAFTSDGRFVAFSEDDETRIWEITEDPPADKTQTHIGPDWSETAHFITRLDPAHDAVWNVAYSSGGKYVLSAGRDTLTDESFVHVWDTASGQLLHRFAGVRGAFSPDESTFALAGEDGTLRLLDLKTGSEIRALEKLPGAPVLLAFSPSGKFLVAQCGDWNIRLLDIEGKTPAHEFTGTNAVLSSNHHWLAFSSAAEMMLDKDYKWVPGQGEFSRFQITGRVEVLDLTAPDLPGQAPTRTFDSPQDGWGWAQPKALANDGTRLLMRNDTSFLWNISTVPPQVTELKESVFLDTDFRNAALSPLVSFLAGVKDGQVRVIDLDTQTAIREFPGNCAIFSPDGKTVLAGTRNGEAKLYKIATGEQIQDFKPTTEKMP